jgi:replicative DNA helicase
MRLPGFWHQKREPFLSMFVEHNHHAPYGPAEIFASQKTAGSATELPEATESLENRTLSITDLLASGAPNGQRNNGLTRVAGLLRSHGMGANVIGELLSAVNEARKIGLPENEVAGIARSVGRYAPSPEHRQPDAAHIMTVDGLHEAWRRERTAHGKPIDFGFDTLNRTVRRFLPGEVLTIAGRSGTGKTSLLIHLARAVAESLDGKSLFVSLEMSAPSLYHRLSTIATATDEWVEVTEDEAHGKVRARFGNQLTVDRDSLTLTQIERYLTLAREGFGAIPVVAIDYLGYVRDTVSGSQYEKVSRIAREIKALAKRAEARLIMACQTSRAGEAGNIPVQLHHLRDSGAIEESADVIVGLWGDTDDPARRHCAILKNRHGWQDVRFDLSNSNLNFSEVPITESKF